MFFKILTPVYFSVLGVVRKKPELQHASCLLATKLVERGQRKVETTHFCLLAWEESNFRSAGLKEIIFNFFACLVEDGIFLTVYLSEITCAFYIPVIKQEEKEKVLFYFFKSHLSGTCAFKNLKVNLACYSLSCISSGCQ